MFQGGVIIMPARSDFSGRGYSMVGLFQPKDPKNIGTALRAAGCFGTSAVVVFGQSIHRVHRTDTMKSYRHIPLIQVEEFSSVNFFDCSIVGVEIVDDAVPIVEFSHPERSLYVFGPENGNLPDSVLAQCHQKVVISTVGCLNLGMAVNIVLYDRTSKVEMKRAQTPPGVGSRKRRNI